MIEHGLKEALDGVARLQAQIFRDPGLIEPRCIQHFGQRSEPIRCCEGPQNTIRIGRKVPCAPTGRTGERDRDVAVRPCRVAQQQSQIVAVGQQARALPPASSTRCALRVGLKR